MILPDGTALRERRVALPGVALHVVEAGPEDGLPVILLHGFPETWWGWRRQIGALARAGFRVVVPDQRGYGGLDKPGPVGAYRLERLGGDVLALAGSLGPGPVALVGHDWGGIVAWCVAARHPERVRRLAILNAPHPDTAWRVIRHDPVQLLRSWYVAAIQLPGLPEWWLARADHAALTQALLRTSRADTFDPEDLARYREAWAEPGALAGMLGWYRALIRHRPAAAGRVRMPTLILWGRRDVALGPRFATESLSLCDDGRIRWFDEATHWLQHEEAEAVNAALIGHFGEGSGIRPDA